MPVQPFTRRPLPQDTPCRPHKIAAFPDRTRTNALSNLPTSHTSQLTETTGTWCIGGVQAIHRNAQKQMPFRCEHISCNCNPQPNPELRPPGAKTGSKQPTRQINECPFRSQKYLGRLQLTAKPETKPTWCEGRV